MTYRPDTRVRLNPDPDGLLVPDAGVANVVEVGRQVGQGRVFGGVGWNDDFATCRTKILFLVTKDYNHTFDRNLLIAY